MREFERSARDEGGEGGVSEGPVRSPARAAALVGPIARFSGSVPVKVPAGFSLPLGLALRLAGRVEACIHRDRRASRMIGASVARQISAEHGLACGQYRGRVERGNSLVGGSFEPTGEISRVVGDQMGLRERSRVLAR